MKIFRLARTSSDEPCPVGQRPLPLVVLLGALSTFSLAVGCGGGEDEGSSREAGGDGDADSDITLGDGDGGDGDGSAGGGGLNADGSCDGLEVGEGCSGQVYEGESVPLDLYLMFDQSGSMSTVVDDSMTNDDGEPIEITRMDIVRSAVEAFLQDDASVGLGVGIGYFGHQPLGETTCDVSEYNTPDVDIGVLPGQEEALLDSLAAREPTGETPTGSAIRGACEYVSTYNTENGGRNPAILLVTDGEPKAPLSEDVCAPTLDDAVAAAEECYEQEGIRVYVLGVGPSLANLTVIAEGGGTDEAFLADLDNAEQVLEAFRAVRFAAQLPCDLALGDSVDDDTVNFSDSTVAYLDFECDYQPVPKLTDQSECGDNAGWYFDDPDAPTTIHLCQVTCDDVKSTGRELFYSLGCPLQVVR